jgi:hypothetical protein
MGFGGRWYAREVVPDITEEEINEMASGLHGKRLAVADYTLPYDGQQFRCYHDISRDGHKTWIDFKMGSPKEEGMIRANMDSQQEAIETVATELWKMEVRCQNNNNITFTW